MPEPQSLLAKLPPKRRKFVREYLKNGGNATQAYIDAGFSKTGANGHAARLVAVGSVRNAIEALRAETEIVIARKTVMDMLELEEHFTSEARGAAYFARIARLEKRLERKENALATLEAMAEQVEDPASKAMLSAQILQATEKIFENEALIAQIHIQGRNESNKAGVTLLKIKGAFDPKRPPADDPLAMLNDMARNMLRAKVRSSQVLEVMAAKARDAEFSVGTGDVEDDAVDSPGGTGEAGRGHLFSRTPPPRTDP